VNLIWWLFSLPWIAYLLGILAAKFLTRKASPVATWLKSTKSKNMGVSLQMVVMPYHRRAFYLGLGNLIFGLLLTVSGLLLGLPPLILLFRSSLMTWGIIGKKGLFSQLEQTSVYLRLLTFAEALLSILWAGLGVEVGLSIIALLTGQSNILAQQKPLLAVLPWLMIGMLTVLVSCALLEAYMMGMCKHEMIRAFFRQPAETETHKAPLPTGEMVS
jgi:uncharacterized membrane protein SpoIIM required for sporulation